MPQKPRVFIGSSSEGKEIADAIQLGLEDFAESTVWHQGVFGLSMGTLDSLLQVPEDFDFAVLVLTPDDLVMRRGESGNSPRDNVIFELGFFMGALGRANTFMVYCKDEELALPSDLAGITAAVYSTRPDANIHAAVGPACTRLRTAISKQLRSLRPTEPWVDFNVVGFEAGKAKIALTFDRSLPFEFQLHIVNGDRQYLSGLPLGWSQVYPNTDQTLTTFDLSIEHPGDDLFVAELKVREMVDARKGPPFSYQMSKAYKLTGAGHVAIERLPDWARAS